MAEGQALELGEEDLEEQPQITPLPQIVSLQAYARHQDPAWQDLSEQQCAELLAAWSADARAQVPDLPAIALLAAIHHLQSNLATALPSLGQPLQQLLQAAGSRLSIIPSGPAESEVVVTAGVAAAAAASQHGSPGCTGIADAQSQWVHGLLAVAFTSSQVLLLGAKAGGPSAPASVPAPKASAKRKHGQASTHPPAPSDPLALTPQQQWQLQELRGVAAECLDVVCAALHDSVLLYPRALELHSTVGQAITQVL
jgi:hypothetical protein